MQSFNPRPENVSLYRAALGRFVTGVTVVTAGSDRRPVGITVNSFTSVSLDPPLVLWCPAKSSRRFALFRSAPHFSIHVLGEDQLALSRRFASGDGLFADLGVQVNMHGVQVLPDPLARFDCAARAVHDAGDHAIIVGQVEHALVRDGAPLVFSGGDYGQFASGV